MAVFCSIEHGSWKPVFTSNLTRSCVVRISELTDLRIPEILEQQIGFPDFSCKKLCIMELICPGWKLSTVKLVVLARNRVQ